MKPVRLIINIVAIHDHEIECLISDEKEDSGLSYFPDDNSIKFAKQNHLSEIVFKHKFQFEKVMRSAIKGKLSPGQIIHCVFIEDFCFLNNEDYNHFIRMDRRDGKMEISTSETEMKDIHRIYADGSFTAKTQHSGYGGIIEDPDSHREIFNGSFLEGSSNLMELLAVTEGLYRLKAETKIQVNTDSRFVIRGLVQWVHFWKFNNWQTAYGRKVKLAEYWQKIDNLCEGKFLEFNWIKGHSGHEEQSFCHDLARESANIARITTDSYK